MNTIHVLEDGLDHPQGLAFDEDGCLWYAEETGKSLICRAPDGQTSRVVTAGNPSSVAYDDGELWYSDRIRNSIHRMHIQTRTIETILTEVAGNPLSAPGNLILDGERNLLFTCPGPADGNQIGWVAGRRANGYAEVLTDGLIHPTGLAFIAGSLLVAEMHRQRIWAGFWDAQNLSWETIRVWATVIETETAVTQSSGPGSMATGPDGNVYVTVYGLGLIRVFSVDGRHMHDIELPGKYPTGCAFDPTGDLGLVIAEAEHGQLLNISV